jgi:nitric oxide reductase large subunit
MPNNENIKTSIPRSVQYIYWIISILLIIAIPLFGYVYSNLVTEKELGDVLNDKVMVKEFIEFRFNSIDAKLDKIDLKIDAALLEENK